MDKQTLYLALLTLHENNFRGLHWKLKGVSFPVDHPRFGEYYDKLGDLMDETAEQMISMGINPIGVTSLVEYLSSDEINASYIAMDMDYSIEMANLAAKTIFDELYSHAAALAADESLPVDVQDVYTEHARYFRIESKYKLARTIMN